jgi:hypothetical protein
MSKPTKNKGNGKDQIFKPSPKIEGEEDQVTELQLRKKILEEKYSKQP